MAHQRILILDFGSQYTQLIARRVRELAVYCEIIPHGAPAEEIASRAPVGLILSGGPQSVYADDAPRCDPRLFALGVPVLGICYGLQLQAHVLGGKVAPSARREYGPASIEICRESPLFAGLPRQLNVWMSHGDEVREAPPGFAVTARSRNASCAIEDPARRLFGLQFHPEVAHTPQGRAILANFVLGVCGAAGDWTMAAFAQESVSRIRAQVGEGRALCGLSGGVDSTVAATLAAGALGERLTCLFVDTGLLRTGEFEAVRAGYRGLPLSLESLDASARFLARLAGVADPEEKRRRIGAEFIAVFDEAAARRGATHLVQGTLYPDVIESAPVKGPSAVIKSHHNVGGLPARMRLSLVEPLRELFKDEVRVLGRQLGLPDALLWRQPFPGPGLAVRILGEVTPERLATLRAADAVVTDEVRRAGLEREVWQAFAVLLPVRSVGVMGDERTYEAAVALRAVTSTDGMTADWARLPPEVLSAISSRIVSEVRGVNRVVYDITPKPPATIEWE